MTQANFDPLSTNAAGLGALLVMFRLPTDERRETPRCRGVGRR